MSNSDVYFVLWHFVAQNLFLFSSASNFYIVLMCSRRNSNIRFVSNSAARRLPKQTIMCSPILCRFFSDEFCRSKSGIFYFWFSNLHCFWCAVAGLQTIRQPKGFKKKRCSPKATYSHRPRVQPKGYQKYLQSQSKIFAASKLSKNMQPQGYQRARGQTAKQIVKSEPQGLRI